MAVIRTIEAQRGIDVGGVPNTRVDGSVGEGLRALGGAIQDVSASQSHIEMARERQRMQIEEFRQVERRKRFEDDMALKFAETEQNIDPSGEGFTDKVSTDFNAEAEKFLKDVPDFLKPKFGELLRTSRETWLNKAAAAEVDQRHAWYRDGITKTQETLQTQVFNDPSVYQAAIDEANRTIDASGLPPVEKQKLKDAWKDTLGLTLGEREARDAESDPLNASGAARRLGIRGASGDPVDQFVDRIIGAESGGNPNAQNPRSSASGVGQFLDSTWVETVRAHRPDIAQGKSAAQILALKSDPVLGREMTKAYAQDNADFLTNQGLEATPGNIYLAHFLGPRGAAEVLKADRGTPIRAIVGGDVVKANPFLAGKTAADTIAWANKKMGRSATEGMDPRYASLPLTKRLEIYDNIQASAERGKAAIIAEQKAAYERLKDGMTLGIETGEVASEQTILSSALNDGDKATLLKRFREESRTAGEVNGLIAAIAGNDASASLNPFAADDRKLGDKAFEKVMTAVPDGQKGAVADTFIRQTGYVPEKIVADTRQGLAATNVTSVADGMEGAARIYDVAPSALEAVPNGSDLKDAALAYREYVYGRGMSRDEAAKRWMDQHSPEAIHNRERLKEPAKDFIKTLAVSDVTNALDTSSLPFTEPSAGLTEDQKLAVMEDYTRIAEEKFVKTGGDADLAKKLALDEMGKLYGASEVAGQNVLMKFPPERYYPPVGGSWDYVREEALTDAKAVGGDAVQNVMLQPTRETADDIRAGIPPRYALYYQDENGVWNEAAGQRFAVDPKAIQTRLQADREERVQKAKALHYNTVVRRQQIEQDRVNTGNLLRGGVTPQGKPAAPKPGTIDRMIQGMDNPNPNKPSPSKLDILKRAVNDSLVNPVPF